MAYLPMVPFNNKRVLELLKANAPFNCHKYYLWRPIHYVYLKRIVLPQTKLYVRVYIYLLHFRSVNFKAFFIR